MRIFVAALLIINAPILAPSALQAEPEGEPAVLEFANGDRLQGLYHGRDEAGQIRFSTLYLGQLVVQESDVVLLLNLQDNETTEPIDSEEREFAGDSPADESGESDVTPKWQRTDVPGLTWIQYPANWSGRLRFSVDLLSSSQTSNRFSFDNLINIRRDSDRFQIQGRYEYEKVQSSGKTTRDRYDGRFRYDHDVSDRNFFQSETIYAVDRVKLINHQLRQTVGYGFLWNGSESYELQIVPGLAGSYTDQSTNTSDENWSVLGRLFQSFRYQFSENYALSQSLEGFIGADDINNYEVNFRIGFTSSLTRKLALEVDYNYEFDNTLASQLNRVDKRLRANIVLQY